MGPKALLASVVVSVGLLALIDRLTPSTDWVSAFKVFAFVFFLPWIWSLAVFPKGANSELVRFLLGRSTRRRSMHLCARTMGGLSVWAGLLAVFGQYYSWMKEMASQRGNVLAEDVFQVLPVFAFPVLVGLVLRWLFYECLARAYREDPVLEVKS